MIQLHNTLALQHMQTMESNSVDLIITDPPYKYDYEKMKSGNGGTLNNALKMDKKFGELKQIGKHEYNIKEFCDEAVRVMKEINIYIWCNKAQIPEYIDYFVTSKHKCTFNIISWYKQDALPSYANKYLDDVEYCLYFKNGKGKCFPQNYKDARTVYVDYINRDYKKYKHKTIKPLHIIQAFVRNSSKPGQVVLDPYMGTGTTGVACKAEGRSFIGIEIELMHYKTSEHRIYNIKQQVQTSKKSLI